MRKRIFVVLIVSMVVMLVVMMYLGRRESVYILSPEDFLSLNQTLTEQDVHKKFGAPSKMLNGFWGDVYELEDGSEVVIYYDADGFVSDVKLNEQP